MSKFLKVYLELFDFLGMIHWFISLEINFYLLHVSDIGKNEVGRKKNNENK